MAKNSKKMEIWTSDRPFEWNDNGCSYTCDSISWGFFAGNEIRIERIKKNVFRLEFLGAQCQKKFRNLDAAKAIAFEFARQVLLEVSKKVDAAQLKHDQQLMDQNNELQGQG